jgi:hypothetical protein
MMRSTPALESIVPVWALAFALPLSLAAGGCTGSVTAGSGSGGGGPGGQNGTGAAGAAAGGGSGGMGGAVSPGSGGMPIMPTTAACPSTDVTPTPLRRLTRYEYANSIKYLLAGVDATPAADLPVDEVSENGFNNDAGVLTVSFLHAEKYVLVSEALAKTAVANLRALTTCDTAARGEETCAVEFARSFGRRAFRRPTTADDERILMAAYTAGRTGGTFAEGIEVMIRAALQSTHFLYRLETTTPANAAAKLVPLSQYELASRLSFMLWASGPDDALLDAAGRGELGSKEAVATKARAMLADPKARQSVTDFYNQWIGTSRLQITSKSAAFPRYTAAARDGMIAELPAFVEHVMWTGDHKLSTLLTSPLGFVTAATAPIYGVAAPSGTSTAPQMATLPAAQGRSGILTQAGFLAVQAHPDQTSPVLRGKFVRTKLMCDVVMMAPDDVDITPPTIEEGATARERAASHLTAAGSCYGCHQTMDPIGLTFENFDAIGTYRETEGGKTIDVTGSIVGSKDTQLNGAFTGVRELGTRLAASAQVRDCAATHWFRYALGRYEEVPDACSLGTLQEKFAASGADLAELVIAMTQTDAFWYRSPITP